MNLKEAQKIKDEMEIQKLKIELKAMKDSKKDIFELVSLLSKNPRAIEMFNTTQETP